MKVLFAVSDDKISEEIVNEYKKKNKEIITYKNVYYFNAILKEIERDQTYDRIVISEELEPFTNNNYEAIDKFMFEKLDNISDEMTRNTSIVLICIDRRNKGDSLLSKLFGIGLYNALLGNDRNIPEVCKLLRMPRSKKEAKIYYGLETDEIEYKKEDENSVSENEIQNILAFYKRKEDQQDRYAEFFDNIAAQYNDTQLRLIIKYLPLNVKAILETDSEKYQSIMTFSESAYQKQKNINEGKKKNSLKMGFIDNKDGKKKLSSPVIVPSAIKKDAVKKLGRNKPINIEDEEETINEENEIKTDEIENKPVTKTIKKVNEEENKKIQQMTSRKIKAEKSLAEKNVKKKNIEEKVNDNVEPTKKKRGRPKKKVEAEVEQEVKPKRGRGRPKKNANVEADLENEEIEEDDILKVVEDDDELINAIKKPQIEDEELLDLDGEEDEDDFLDLEEEENEEDDDLLDLDDEEENEEDDDLLDLDEEEENEEEDDDLLDLDDEEENEEDDDDLLDLDEEENEEDDDLLDLDEEENEEEENEEEDDDLLDLDEEENEEEDDDLLDLDEEENEEDDDLLDLDEEENEEDDDLLDLDEEENKEEDDDLLDLDEEENKEEEDDLLDLDEEENEEEDDDLLDLDEEENEEDDDDLLDLAKEENEEDNDIFDNSKNKLIEKSNDKTRNIVIQKNNSREISVDEIDFSNLLTPDKKLAAFIGTSKNGTSFLVNNIAMILADMGIKTSILDLTKNKNSYYIFTKNEEDLRKVAYSSFDNLKNGIAQGISVNRNLSVYTALPGTNNDITDVSAILPTLIRSCSVVLLDCDFDTPISYFAAAQEIYLVQSMDILTIQPLTYFLKELKSVGIDLDKKARVIINKEQKVKNLSKNAIIGGLSSYNDPAMSYMTKLFDKDKIINYSLPLDVTTGAKYLETLVTCELSLSGYTKSFIEELRRIAMAIYSSKKGARPGKMGSIYDTNSKFSNNMNSTLDEMKRKY